MPVPGMSDPSQQVGAQYVATVRDDLLAKLLEHARFGTLDPQWRSTAMSAKERLYPHAVTDDDRAAVMELQQLPPQAWEPHRAPWRVALDAWFIAQFGVNERARVRSAQTYLSLLEMRGMTVLSKFTVDSLTGTYTDESVIEELTTLPTPSCAIRTLRSTWPSVMSWWRVIWLGSMMRVSAMIGRAGSGRGQKRGVARWWRTSGGSCSAGPPSLRCGVFPITGETAGN